MIPLFVGLTLVNLLTFAVAGALGYLSVAGTGQNLRGWHMLAGGLAGIVACGVHCFVFTYFVATAKWMQHAVVTKKLDESFIAPTRSFKKQAFPAAMFAIAVSLIATFSGAARDTRMISQTAHHAITAGAFAINILVAIVEYRALARNGLLIDSILAAVGESNQPAQVI